MSLARARGTSTPSRAGECISMVRMITSAARARGQAASVISEHRRHPGGPLLLSAGIGALHVPPFYARSLASLPVDRAGHPAHSGNLRWLSTSRLRQPALGRGGHGGAMRVPPLRSRPTPRGPRASCRRAGGLPRRPLAASGSLRILPPGPPLSSAILPNRGVLPSPSLGNGSSRRRRRCTPTRLSVKGTLPRWLGPAGAAGFTSRTKYHSSV